MVSKSLPLAVNARAMAEAAQAKRNDLARQMFFKILDESTKAVDKKIKTAAKDGRMCIFVNSDIHPLVKEMATYPTGFNFGDLLNCLKDRLKENGYKCNTDNYLSITVTW